MIEARRIGVDSASLSLDHLARGLASVIGERAERPFFVELAGTPRAGKTTALRMLAELLRTCGLHVETVPESASGCPIPEKRHPHFNLWTFCTTVTRVLAAQHGGTDVLLVDRGIVDAACWMEWYRETGCLTSDEHRTIEEFVLLPRWSKMIDLVLVMRIDPATALERGKAARPEGRPGRIVNAETLCQFNAAIGRVQDRLRRTFPLVPVDTTGLDRSQVLHRVLEAALSRG